VKRPELEVEYRKVEMNKKTFELVVAMDAHKLKIATKQTKRLEKENVDLNTKLSSQVANLRESIKTIERLQLSIQEPSCHVPITRKQLEDLQQQIWLFTQKAKEADYTFHRMAKLEEIIIENTFMKVELFMK
jgi:hypothetical protein